MRLCSAALLAAAALTAGVPGVAPSPLRQQVLQAPPMHGVKFNPLEHMSGIAPYHDAPGANISPPKGCRSLAMALLIRHSSIVANDDEWEDYMEPFVQRLDAHRAAGAALPESGRLAFLREWQSPINNDNLEQLTQPGAHDATVQGRRLRKLHPHLFPPMELGRPGGKEALAGKVKTPFKVWTASSERDIETSKAWIRGAFPEWQRGDDGEGDGKFLTLVKVPNKNPDWGASLTPHKVCKGFSKEPGKPEAQQWLETFGPRPLAALRDMAPEFPWELNDVIALAMLCGYESVIKGVGKTEFCSVLQPDDFRDFGYWNDIKYHHFVGYKSPMAPYLGMPWLNTSLHNLEAATTGKHPHLQSGDEPAPIPPNATHTQFLLPYFTHREEPPVVITALGLMNQTAQYDLPLDHNPADRVWKTSHVLPFLGHVGIERLTCDAGSEGSDYIRVVINGAVQHLEHCQSGPGKSCPMEQYKAFVAERMEQYGDIEGACGGIKT